MNNKSFPKKVAFLKCKSKYSNNFQITFWKQHRFYVELKQCFSLDASLKKSWTSLCWAFEMCFGGALSIAIRYCVGRSSVRKAWCVLEHVMFSVLVLLCQACLQVWAWHCACCGTRSQGDPAVKDHVRGQCCHVPSHGCLHSHHVRGNIWILIIWWMLLSVWRKE